MELKYRGAEERRLSFLCRLVRGSPAKPVLDGSGGVASEETPLPVEDPVTILEGRVAALEGSVGDIAALRDRVDKLEAELADIKGLLRRAGEVFGPREPPR